VLSIPNNGKGCAFLLWIPQHFKRMILDMTARTYRLLSTKNSRRNYPYLSFLKYKTSASFLRNEILHQHCIPPYYNSSCEHHRLRQPTVCLITTRMRSMITAAEVRWNTCLAVGFENYYRLELVFKHRQLLYQSHFCILSPDWYLFSITT
jgi:hypothetical protein